ncbi:MAG: hypothetical protein ABW321_24825 [Polyangiales bacterium]
MTKPNVPVLIAAGQLVLALLVSGGVFIGLPARWAWVDVPAVLIALAASVSAFGLLRRAAWGLRVATWVLWAELVLGSLTVTLLAVAAAQLAGSYGPVGGGGAVLLVTIALLVTPYFLVFPALQLAWLRRAG